MSLTNMYIDADEYELLSVHSADALTKIRYFLDVGERHVTVNEFEEHLAGLILLEAEFGNEDEMAAFTAPEFVIREVSVDDRFSGGQLARTTAAELRDLLAE